MTHSTEYPMSEYLAWVQWWAFPWRYADEEWKDGLHGAINALSRSRGSVPGVFMGVNACLPPALQPTVLRLALASNEQLDLALTLAHDTLNPQVASLLSESHHQWCSRLSKTLPPAMLSLDADPLQLLHNWLEPAIWQRLRLRFPRQRVDAVVKSHACLESASSRLSTLWQAVIWRVNASPSHSLAPDSYG